MLYTVKDTGEDDRKRAAMRGELDKLFKVVRETDEFEGAPGAAVDPDEGG